LGLSVSAGKRYADEGYFEGTTYDGNSSFLSVEKKLNDSHSLSLDFIPKQSREEFAK
jgi:hypothetical protein